MSKYYIKKLSSPTNIIVFLDPCPFSSIYILMAVMFPRGFWYKISLRWRFVTSATQAWTDNSVYYITLRVSFNLGKWWGHLLLQISLQGLPRLLTLHWIVQQAANVRFDHCDLFQLSSLWRWSCDGKSTRIARPLSRTTTYRSCTVQPSQGHCTPGSAVPFAPCQSPLSSSPCAFLSGWGAQHALPQAFQGQCIYLKNF